MDMDLNMTAAGYQPVFESQIQVSQMWAAEEAQRHIDRDGKML